MATPSQPGIRTTTNGNQLVSCHTEAKTTEGGQYGAGDASPVAAEIIRDGLAADGVDAD